VCGVNERMTVDRTGRVAVAMERLSRRTVDLAAILDVPYWAAREAQSNTRALCDWNVRETCESMRDLD
jgi:hypothetical protein